MSPTESYSLRLTILLRYYGHTKIVKGRARHPESQGAVERGNAPFKEALQKWMQDKNTTSWAGLGCFVTQAQINKRPSRAKGNFSPYEAFFGQVPKSAPQNYLSQELLSLCESEDGLYAAYELVKSSNGEATDEEIKSAITQGDKVYEEFVPRLSASSKSKRPLPEGSDMSTCQDNGKKVKAATEGIVKSTIQDVTKKMVTVAVDTIVAEKPFNKSKASTNVFRNSSRNTRGSANLPMSQIIKKLLAANQTYTFRYPRLKCGCCFSGSHLLSIGDDSYLHDNENTKRWWDSDFISTN